MLDQLETITSYSDPAGGSTNIVNQVKHVHNDLGQLIEDHQEHDGEVDASTLKVQYDYDLTASGGLYSKSARPTKLTYPNGRDLYYGYDSVVVLAISPTDSISPSS